MVGGLHGRPSATILCVCILMWATRRCAGLYFYAHDYSSWMDTVNVYRNTTIVRDGGLLQMNPYINGTIGRALYKTTFQMQNSTNGSLASFNTSFIFSMNTDRAREFFGDGIAFLICPNPFRGTDLQVSAGGYLGMFNSSTTGQLRNQVFAVEFDTHLNQQFRDPNDNHIGVDVNSVISLRTNDLVSLGIQLNGGRKIVCWVDYDGIKRYLWVYLAYSPSAKPSSPAISMDLDLAPYMKNQMYVGFSSATGTRAELHTIYSWWFLAGFGNLTLPLSPSISRQPLASLGKRSIVITVFTLAVVLLFLCCLCLLAGRQWRERSKHLIDILLPVACWMYWKESITEELRSTRCLKLAMPTVELLAWLWRTRWVRRYDRPLVGTWRQILLKRKMRPQYRGEAWQLENKRRKRRKPHGALHVMVYEEQNEEDNSDEGGRVKMIAGKHYKVATDAYMIVGEENKAKLFQRRGSFSIPQCPPGDDCEHEVELAEETDAAGSIAAPALVQQAIDTLLVEDGIVPRLLRLKPETVWISTQEKLFQRRGSFSVQPEDATELTMGQASGGHKDQQRPAEYLVEHDTSNPRKAFDAMRRGSFSVPSEDRMEFIGVQVPTDGNPHMEFTGEDDIKSISREGIAQRRGSFSMHPEDSREFSRGRAAKEDEKQHVEYVVEHDAEVRAGKSFFTRRGSFSVHPDDAAEFTGRQAVKPGKDQQRHATNVVDHHAGSSFNQGRDARRGSFMLVEEAASSTMRGTPGPSDQTLQSTGHAASDQPPELQLAHISNVNEDGKSHVAHRWLFD